MCGSHLLRELTFIIDSNQYQWARNVKKVLLETCREVAKKDEKCFSSEEYAALQNRYRNNLPRGEKEVPPLLEKPKGRRGRIAQSDAHNL